MKASELSKEEIMKTPERKTKPFNIPPAPKKMKKIHKKIDF